MKRLARLFLPLVFFPAALFAHDPGLSTTDVAVGPESIVVTLGFAPADMKILAPGAEGPALLKIAPEVWEIRGAGGRVLPRETASLPAPANSVIFRLVYPRPDGGRLSLRSLVLDRLPPGHRDYLTVEGEDHRLLAEKLVDASAPSIDLALPAAATVAGLAPVAGAGHTFAEFFRLGVAHIWTGYDHLLFLFGLLVVCRRFRSVLVIISCFTIAHSLTLALATLNVVHLSSRLVEPAIAASIAFVGVENLLRRGQEPPARWALTFFFGLIHGFGFAGALRELGVGSNGHGIVVPLFSFNLGVEAGQVAVAAVALPILWHLRRREVFLRRCVPALSALVALAGVAWFLQRTLFS